MNKEEIKRKVDKVVTRSKLSGNELQIPCPFCHDKRLKFYFNVVSHKGHCFLCNRAVRGLDSFFKVLGIDPVKERTSSTLSWAAKRVNVFQRLLKGVREEVAPYLSMHPLPPDNYRALDRPCKIAAREVLGYLRCRGFNKQMIELLDPRISPTFLNWFILPIKCNGSVVYWVRRTLLQQEPKYLTPAPIFGKYGKADVVWGGDLIKVGKPVIICEGIFSAATSFQYTAIPSVALLGKTLSSAQKIFLFSKKPSEVIVMLDGIGPGDNTLNKSEEIARRFRDYLPVKIIRLPENKDPNDLKKKIQTLFNS